MQRYGAYFMGRCKNEFSEILKANNEFSAILEANNEFSATFEQRLKDIPCTDKLKEFKKVVWELKVSLKLAQEWECASISQQASTEKNENQAASLDAQLWVIGNKRKAAFEKVSSLETQIKVLATKQVENLRLGSYDTKPILLMATSMCLSL